MRVAEREPLAHQQAKEEAEGDLSGAVAVLVAAILHLREALPFDVLADEHAAS